MPLRHLIVVTIILLATIAQAGDSESEKQYTILVLGDSLTAGHGLVQGSDFPTQLEQALQQRGYSLRVINAGVSGDTSAGGLRRLNWALAERPDLVIIELGANDALRALDPSSTKENLAAIIEQIKEQKIKPLLVGMKAPRNLGRSYYHQFDRIYPDLAMRYDIPLYPFFLEGIATDPKLNQADGLHPTAEGIAVIVEKIVPLVAAQISNR